MPTEKSRYGPEDCVRSGTGMFIAGFVAVIDPEALPEDQRGVRQLLFCEGGAGSFPNAADDTVRAVFLSNGECVIRKRGELLGLLSPNCFPTARGSSSRRSVLWIRRFRRSRSFSATASCRTAGTPPASRLRTIWRFGSISTSRAATSTAS